VVPLPGASASLAALVSAGLPTDRFFFEGFLPPKTGARRTRITELKSLPATLVLYETGPRLPESLADLAAGLGGRPAAVCRELTKTFEEVRRGPLDQLAAHYAGAGSPKGEIVLVIGPPSIEEPGEQDIDSALRVALTTLSVKDAAAAVATATGHPRRTVYARALALQAERDGEETAD
jgi:16S rRNA (cytidine1402-2'-O)-methyltransferase